MDKNLKEADLLMKKRAAIKEVLKSLDEL